MTRSFYNIGAFYNLLVNWITRDPQKKYAVLEPIKYSERKLNLQIHIMDPQTRMRDELKAETSKVCSLV